MSKTATTKTYTLDLNEGLKMGPMTAIKSADEVTPSAEEQIIKSNEDAKRKEEEGGDVKPPVKEEEGVSSDNEIRKDKDVKSGGGDSQEALQEEVSSPDQHVQDGRSSEGQKEGASSEEEVADTGSSSDDDGPDNLGYYLAKQLQAEGYISPDFEPGEDINTEQVYQAVRDGLYDTVANEVISNVKSELQREGITQDMLVYARAIHNGMDLESLNVASVHNRYSRLEGKEDVSHDDIKASIQAMHTARGLSSEESTRLINSAENDGDLDTEFKRSIDFHKSKYKEFQDQEKARHAEIENLRREAEARQINTINKVIQSREALGQKLTPEQAASLRDDIYAQTEVVNIQGQNYNASAFQSWLHQFQNDPEVQLHAFLSFKYRDRAQEVAESSAKAKIEKNFLDQYTAKVKNPAKKEAIKKEEPKPKPKGEAPKPNIKTLTRSLIG